MTLQQLVPINQTWSQFAPVKLFPPNNGEEVKHWSSPNPVAGIYHDCATKWPLIRVKPSSTGDTWHCTRKVRRWFLNFWRKKALMGPNFLMRNGSWSTIFKDLNAGLQCETLLSPWRQGPENHYFQGEKVNIQTSALSVNQSCSDHRLYIKLEDVQSIKDFLRWFLRQDCVSSHSQTNVFPHAGHGCHILRTEDSAELPGTRQRRVSAV